MINHIVIEKLLVKMILWQLIIYGKITMLSYIKFLPFDLINELSCYLSYKTCRRLLSTLGNINTDNVWKYKIIHEFDVPSTTCDTILPLHIKYIELKSDIASDFGTDIFGYPRDFCNSLTEEEVLNLVKYYKTTWFKMYDKSPIFLCTYYAAQGNAPKFIETYENHGESIVIDLDDQLYRSALTSKSQEIVEFIKQKLDTDDLELVQSSLHYMNGNLTFIKEHISKKAHCIYEAIEHKQWAVVDYVMTQNIDLEDYSLVGLIRSKNIDKCKQYIVGNIFDRYAYNDYVIHSCATGVVDILDYVLSLINCDIQSLKNCLKYALHYYHLDNALYLYNKIKSHNEDVHFPLEEKLQDLIEKFEELT